MTTSHATCGCQSGAQRLLGRWPASALEPFHRIVRFRPTGLPTASAERRPFRVNLLSATPTSTTDNTTTPGTTGLILLWVSQSWLVRGQDPLDPNVYSRMQDEQGSRGQFSMALAVGNRNVGQISESIYDYGTPDTQTMPGWTLLNRNLIDFGHATASPAVYVPPQTKLEALFYQNPSVVWLHEPDAIEVEINGYVCPASLMSELMRQ